MSESEGCKRSVEITVPVEEVVRETGRVVESLQKKVRLPGFRPGKVPASLVRGRFRDEIRQEVLENLVPRYFRKRAEDENLRVVGNPDVVEVHFEEGEPLRFKAEFEVAPEIELGEYKGIAVPYHEPEITEEILSRRMEEIREQKAEYINEDPRPAAAGDYAVVALESIGEVPQPPIRQDEMMLLVGGQDTLAAFTENLTGMTPGERKEFDVPYPEDYGEERLAGKTVRFHVTLKGIRRKELPELNDEFARDLGDYKDLAELREAVRKSLFAEFQYVAQQVAKTKLVEKLVDAHNFPVPEAFVERQIEAAVEQHLRQLAARGVDPSTVRLDWEKIKQSQRDKAIRQVKESMLLDRIADRETIEVTRDEVDREVQRIARQGREAVAVVRARLEKDGTLGRIAHNIRIEKTLNFLFEHARKVAED